MINSRKIIFFLLVYYLCLSPLLYMGSCYYTEGNILLKNTVFNAIYLEQVVCISTVFLILVGYIKLDKYLNFYSACTIFLYIWICFIIMASFFDVGQVAFGQYYSFSNIIIGKGFVFMLLGLNIDTINDMLKVKKACIIFYTNAAIYFTAILLSAFYNPFAVRSSWYLEGITKTTLEESVDSKFDYLYISDVSALLLLFIISRARSINIKFFIIVFGAFVLFLSGSRASFICFLSASFLALIIHFFKNSFKKMIFLSFLIILLIYPAAKCIPMLFNAMNDSDIKDNRFNFFNITERDSSYLLRKEIFEEGLVELEETWLNGRYMSEVINNGNYLHNYLSFWSSFGIGPFILLVFLLLSALYRVSVLFLKDSKSSVNELLFLWSLYIISIIISARAYDFYYIWFILMGVPMLKKRSQTNNAG